MTRIDDHTHAELDLTLNWTSEEIHHSDCFYAPYVNTWRDLFPEGVLEGLMGHSEGETLKFHFPAGKIVPPRSRDRVYRIRHEQFGACAKSEKPMIPRLGRFYPCGLTSGLPGIYPENMHPMRVMDVGKDEITVDLNHPLADMEVELQIRIRTVRQSKKERGGRVTHWGEEIVADGPGMQAAAPGIMTDFGSAPLFAGEDEEGEGPFCTPLRSASHVDERSSRILGEVYREQVKPGCRVLDLMSNVVSHLPRGVEKEVVGLGRNEEEMAANPLLSKHVVQDLNENPELPFPEDSFDLVLLSHSMESLTHPGHVVREVHRVLQADGSFLVGLTDCRFSTKATRLWIELHPFERLGWVLSLFADAGFRDCFTRSYRNWPRPYEDPHYPFHTISDPVLIAGGVKKTS